jgi:hypothetical protein
MHRASVAVLVAILASAGPARAGDGKGYPVECCPVTCAPMDEARIEPKTDSHPGSVVTTRWGRLPSGACTSGTHSAGGWFSRARERASDTSRAATPASAGPASIMRDSKPAAHERQSQFGYG